MSEPMSHLTRTKKSRPLPNRHQLGSTTTVVLTFIALASVVLLAIVSARFFMGESLPESEAARRARLATASQAKQSARASDAASAGAVNAAQAGANADGNADGSGTQDGSAFDSVEDEDLSELRKAQLAANRAAADSRARRLERRLNRGQAQTGTKATGGTNPGILLPFAVDGSSASPDEDAPAASAGGGGGFQIQKVIPGTPMFEAGLRPNDRIVSVNGQETASWKEIIDSMGLTPPGDPIEIRFETEGGSPQSVTLEPPFCCVIGDTGSNS